MRTLSLFSRLILCPAIPGRAHDVWIQNAVSAQRDIRVGDLTFFVSVGEVLRLSDVPEGIDLVSTNGGWTLPVDSVIAPGGTFSSKLLLVLCYTNGVESFQAFPMRGNAYWIAQGGSVAVLGISLVIALALMRWTKSPLPERD